MIQRASPWTTAELARATAGHLAGDPSLSCSGVSTDTRDALSGTLFVALQGERFDAHDFLGDAVARGAAALLVSRPGLAKAHAQGFRAPSPSYPIVEVDDTLFALGELGRAHRRRVNPRVLALTGSNGKTTTKELLAAILSVSRRVSKTEGNLNNLIGVPMTLLGLRPEHEVAVVEMGMNVPGEIARYTAIAEPDVGVINNVGPAHIGNLGSLDAIGDAKGELFHGMDRTRAVAVVNVDDPQVVRVAQAANVAHQRTFGWSDGADVRVLAWEPIFDTTGAAAGRAIYSVDRQELPVELPFAGRHIAMNAAAAIATATATTDAARWSVSLDDVVRGLPAARGAGRRMSFEPVGPYLLVDDCYNANSASMLAAFETVSSRIAAVGGRFVAVLGEMRELGAHSKDEHAKVGRAVAERGAAIVAALGAEARALADAASKVSDVRWEATDADALWAWLAPRLQPGDVVLVKGSRGMKMERFVDWLRAHAGVPSTRAGESH